MQDRDAVTKPFGVVHHVGREDHALAVPFGLDHELAHISGGEHVEVGRGLIEHQHLRVVDDRARDRELLLLPGGKALGSLVGKRADVEALDDCVDATLQLSSRHSAELREVGDVLTR